jgi:nicotinamide riboside kinase
MTRGFVITLLGAESTGKTTLARDLGAALAAPDRSVAVVGEYLREFCDRHGRTPRRNEQAGIAAEQTQRIAAAALAHDVVVADTSALMIAVYSEHVFGDTSLYIDALAAHARCDLTLLTALDLPWRADGLQRDGPQVCVPIDARVRRALGGAGLPFAVVGGRHETRLANALAAARRALAPALPPDAPQRWHGVCERCGDADCERHLLPRM